MDMDLILEIGGVIGTILMVFGGAALICWFCWTMEAKAEEILEELKQIKKKLDKKD